MGLRLLGFVIFLFSSNCLVASSSSGSSFLRDLIQSEWIKGKTERNVKKFNESCMAREQDLQFESDKFFNLSYEALRQKASYGTERSKKFYRDLHKESPIELDVRALNEAQVDVWFAGMVLAEKRRNIIMDMNSLVQGIDFNKGS